MACSDNTIRAGLTPKFKDIETLCENLTYRMSDPLLLEPKNISLGVLEYAPNVSEFCVHRISVSFILILRKIISITPVL